MQPLTKIRCGTRYTVGAGVVACVMSCLARNVGQLPDGSTKVRPIDDMSASDINAATSVSEKLVYDTLDLLHESMRCLVSATGVSNPIIARKVTLH